MGWADGAKICRRKGAGPAVNPGLLQFCQRMCVHPERVMQHRCRVVHASRPVDGGETQLRHRRPPDQSLPAHPRIRLDPAQIGCEASQFVASILRERERVPSLPDHIAGLHAPRMMMCSRVAAAGLGPGWRRRTNPPSLCSGFLDDGIVLRLRLLPSPRPGSGYAPAHAWLAPDSRGVGRPAMEGQATNTRPHAAPLAASDLLQPDRQ